MIRATLVLLCLALPAALLAETSVRRSQAAMMKPVICRVLEDARGKQGEALAALLEADGARLAQSNYELAAIVPGDPPIACYRGRIDAGKLPRGAR